MPLKSLKKLPVRARRMWESVFNEMKDKYSEERAAKIAWEVVKRNYKSARSGKKSMTVEQPLDNAGDSYIDVLLGYPGPDKQVFQGGYRLSDAGWNRIPQGVLKGDMEHYYADKAEGLYIDLDEAWEGWVPVAQRFWNGEDGGLYARVELPENHPQTPNFISDWSSGKYGLSIDYAYPEEAVEYTWEGDLLVPEIKEWHITGFTFTEEPAFEKTKQDGKENI